MVAAAALWIRDGELLQQLRILLSISRERSYARAMAGQGRGGERHATQPSLTPPTISSHSTRTRVPILGMRFMVPLYTQGATGGTWGGRGGATKVHPKQFWNSERTVAFNSVLSDNFGSERMKRNRPYYLRALGLCAKLRHEQNG